MVRELPGTFNSRLWGYDPLLENKYKLSIRDVLQLDQYGSYKGVYKIANHPVTTVWIMGDVISILIKEKYISYKVDDGTGCIRCVWWHDGETTPPEVRQGHLVTIIGKVAEYKERNHIYVTLIERASDPNQEVYHCLDIMHLRPLYKEPYDIPSSRNRSLVRSLKEALCYHLSASDGKSVTLGEMTAECKSNELITPTEVFDSNVDTDCVIKEALQEMVKGGYLIEAEPDHYKFLSDEEILSPLMTVFEKNRDQRLSIRSLLETVTRDFSSVPDILPLERLEQIIETMVDRNLVYPVGDQHDSDQMIYKIVN